MQHAFAVGDRVRLNCLGLAELTSFNDGKAAPSGTGEVSEIGFIFPDDVIVQWDGIGIQCDPDWLVVAEG
jgi:hypothetical protein